MFQVHGGFSNAHCVECKAECDIEDFKKSCLESKVLKCVNCKNGIIKPDITFFGEPMPSDFIHCVTRDFPKCDCLIIIGTSLQVQPFASLIHNVNVNCPRILINREEVILQTCRDLFLHGDCDEGTAKLDALFFD